MVVDFDGSLLNCFYSDQIGHINNIDNLNAEAIKDGITKLDQNHTCHNCRGHIFCGVTNG
jgi:radical SAM protein with 4Fe4S-binding SPASM domain